MRPRSVFIGLPLVVALGWLVDAPTAPTPARSMARLAVAPGALALTAAPAKATPARAVVTVQVANTGGDAIGDIAIRVDAPAGIRAMTQPDRVPTLAAGASRLATVTAIGMPDRRPATLLVTGMLADLGYLGTGATTGTRKPPTADLTDVQRACNKSINSARAAVERAIAHLVNWKVLDTGWRGRLTDFPEVLRTVTALEIYRTWG